MTGLQDYESFGNKLPKSIIQDFKKGVDSEIKFLECIYLDNTIFNKTTKKIVLTNKKYVHVIYLFKENEFIAESGYDEIP